MANSEQKINRKEIKKGGEREKKWKNDTIHVNIYIYIYLYKFETLNPLSRKEGKNYREKLKCFVPTIGYFH